MALAVGRFTASSPMVAVLIALAVLLVGVMSVNEAAVTLASLPALFVVLRAGSGGVDLSFSDLVLGVATVAAVLFAPRPFSPELRRVLWLSAAYQLVTLFTVLNNPYRANVIEWFHAWMLVAGALLVGWSVGANGHARLGLRLIEGTILVLSGVAIVHAGLQYARGDFGPVYLTWPFGMHKNFVGVVCGVGAAIAYVNPPVLGWSKRWARVVLVLTAVAMLTTQSRQAVVGLVAVIFVVVLRSRTDRRRSKLALLIALPMALFVTNLVQDQIQSGNKFNSVFQRLTWFQDSLDVWQTDPWFGVGLRWWYTDRFAVAFQPPNAEIEVLTSAGVLGLVAFLVLMIGSLVIAWRMEPALGGVAVAVLLSRLVQAQFDLFWVAVQTSVPFVILGLCLGAQHLAGEGSGDRAVGQVGWSPATQVHQEVSR